MHAGASKPALRPRQRLFGTLRLRPLPILHVSKPLPGAGVALAAKGDVLLMAETIGKTHDGEKILFEGLTFTVAAGDKLAVIGPNGCGKSTLLRIVAGIGEHDQGMLSRNKGARIGYLPQDPQLPEDATVLQAVLSSDSDMARAVQNYQKALASAATGVITKELEVAIEQMDVYDAWEIDSEAKRILEAVGVVDVNQPVKQLSGGQKKRVALASALMGTPDLLIMDEPTNHLDVKSIRWMQEELRREGLAVVMVSHDRYFLEEVCDRMLELDMGRSVMHNFGGRGSYDRFKEARQLRRLSQANAAADAKTLLRKEAVWMSRQPQGRQAKQRARQDKFYELTDRARDGPKADLSIDFSTTGMARQGNKVVRMERLSYVAPPLSSDSLAVVGAEASSSGRGSGVTGRTAATAGASGMVAARALADGSSGSSAEAATGVTIIRDFTYDFAPGERLGIVGRNGTGKTTLLELITGRLAPTSGSREAGETAHVGYFTQYPPEVRYDMRIIDYIREVADNRKGRPGYDVPGTVPDPPEILLEKLGFTRPRQYQKVSSLSGGERRRLHLATVLIERPNVLVLDEPTNDLDIATVEVLEDLLASFKGVLLCVSHDRAFMDNVADKLLVLKGDGPVRVFEGSYSEYLEMVDEEEATEAERVASGAAASTSSAPAQQQAAASKTVAAANGNGAAAAKPAAAAATKKPKKLGFYEAEEYKKLTREIEKLGHNIKKLSERVMALSGNAGAGKLKELETASLQLGNMEADMAAKEERWFELAEMAGEI